MSDADEQEWPLRPVSLEGGRGTYRLTARLGARGAAEVYAGRVVRAAGAAGAPAGTPCLIEIRRRGALPDPQADAAAAAAFAGQAALLDALPPDAVLPALDAFAWEGEAVAVFPAAALARPDAGPGPRPFPLWRRLRAGTDAVSALAAVHHAGILHRNLDPGAVVLGADGAWRLTGFELAGRVAPDGAAPAAVTPAAAYAAPEYFLGAQPDVRSDVYSAGATLYYLCTGRPPAPATTAGGIARWHARGTPAVPPPALAPDLPAGIGEVLLRCLDPDPAARFQTAARLRAALLAAAAEVEPDGPEADAPEADAPEADAPEATRRPAVTLPLTLAGAMAPAPAPALRPKPAPRPAGRETAPDASSEGRPPTPVRPWWRTRRGMAAGAAAGAVLLVLWAGRGRSGGGQPTVPPSTPAAAASATARAAASAAGTATAVAESTVVARARAEASLAAAGDALAACSAVIAPVLQRPPAPAPAAPEPAGPPFSPQTAPRIAAYRTLGSHRAVVLGLAFAPAGDLLASSSGDQTIKVWPVFERPELLSPPGQPGSIESVAYAPNGAVFAGAGDDGAARLWRAGEADAACVLPHGTPVRAVAFSPDGALLATSGDDGAVRLWGVGGSGLRVLESGVTRGERAASGLAFSPDGRLLAAGGADGAVRLWDAASGAPSRTLSGHTDRVQAVAFSPDGRLLASAGADGAARLWDVGAGQQVAAFAHSGPVWAVAFSPDGRLLASGGGDNAVRLWRTEGCPGGGESATCATGVAGGLPGAVRAVAFSPDGRLLASAGADGAVRLWRTTPG
jgi:hypothetical protein